MDTIRIEKIIRSRRRTIALEVTEDATLIVRAPLRAPVAYIEELIRQKSIWITRKIGEARQRPAPVRREFVNGEEFPFLGTMYPLHILNTNERGIVLRDKLFVPQQVLPDIRNQLKRWYVQEAEKKIEARCAWYSLITGIEPVSLRITDTRRRWGSCSSKGTLSFCWRLILAPLEIVDYVIVHELIHLEQPDHSGRFWDKVRHIMPDYEWRKRWLKENGQLLEI